MVNNTFKYLNKNEFKQDPIVFAIPESFVQHIAKDVFGMTLEEDELWEFQHAMLCPDISCSDTFKAMTIAIRAAIERFENQEDQEFLNEKANSKTLGKSHDKTSRTDSKNNH